MRVLIVDDETLFAEVVAFTIERRDVEIVGIASTCEDAVRIAIAEQPDVALIDLNLRSQWGTEVCRALKRAVPELRAIAVSGLGDAETIRDAFQAGFDGYLTKTGPLARIRFALDAVMRGETVRPPQPMTTASVNGNGASSGEREIRAMAARLTPRELDVLSMLVRGHRTEAIARLIGVTGGTVRTHVKSILLKLQVHSRIEAVALAVRYGIVERPRVVDLRDPPADGWVAGGAR